VIAGTGALAVLAVALTWLLMPSVADLEMRVQARLAPLGQRELPLTAIAPVLRQAVIATEDERFYAHRGIDTVGWGARSSTTSAISRSPRAPAR
jgi:membrane peptidoglycan carboxypeptidase